ncbi:white collar, partial [Diplocarpon rosae]
MSGDADSGEGEFFDLQPPPSSAREVKTEDVMKRLFSAEHLHLILGDPGIPILRDLVGDLAEVFCLTDPSVHDNPIIFASQGRNLLPLFSWFVVNGPGEFHRTTQYGTTYAIDRNCRFLQGPGTDKNATLRIAKAVSLGQESNEVLLNYRRDGTPFVNLLMCSPLYDDKGTIRYYIGAQVDVTGLVIDGLGIESFRALLHNDEVKRMEAAHEAEHKNLQSKFSTQPPSDKNKPTKDSLTRLQELGMMFSQDESDVVNRNSRGADDSTDASSIRSGAPSSGRNRGQSKRVIIDNGVGPDGNVLNFSHHIHKPHPMNTNLPGIYKHASQPLLCRKYLLVRPYPSLQIIFVSPSLRIPGLLRTHLFTKLGGPTQTISALESAFRDGASVTAKVLWLPKNTYAGERGRGPAEVKPRYIRCTPLLGSDDRVGVWMVILVPVDGEPTHDGYPRDPVHEMVDELGEERKFYDGRSASTGRSRNPSRAESVRQGLNFDTEGQGGLGSKSNRGSRTGLPVGRGDVQRGNGFLKGLRCVDMDEKQLYAEYLRSSSGTAESREDGMPMRGKER